MRIKKNVQNVNSDQCLSAQSRGVSFSSHNIIIFNLFIRQPRVVIHNEVIDSSTYYSSYWFYNYNIFYYQIGAKD